MRPTQVLLVDSQALFRDGMASLLESWGLKIVGQASDGDDAIEQALAVRPDLVLLDLRIPGPSSLEVTVRIKTMLPETKVVILTTSDDEHDLVEAIKAGADGYLLKNMRGDELAQKLDDLSLGIPPIAQALVGKLLGELARQVRTASTTRHTEKLTQREVEILRSIAEGATNKQVARVLAITESTVHYHVRNILRKLHAHTRAEAAVRALSEGLISATS